MASFKKILQISLVVFGALVPVVSLAATEVETDSLLRVLDGIVAHKQDFEGQKRASIERHLYRLKNAVEPRLFSLNIARFLSVTANISSTRLSTMPARSSRWRG